MSLQPIQHQTVLESLVNEYLGGKLHKAEPLSGGHSGFVYRAKVESATGSRTFCIKLTPWFAELPYEALPWGQRVYGTRPSNFDAAHELMQSANIPVPTLYASGTVVAKPSADTPEFFFQIMDLLEGVDVRTFLAGGDHEQMDALHCLVGETMGRLHQITRGYDGWVAQSAPYAANWKTAFFSSFQEVIDRACSVNDAMRVNRSKLVSFLQAHDERWIAPTEFVFSHVDGFQGMASYADSAWRITGLVDIEDHSFTDARFVLAGHELSLRFEQRETPTSFWAGYQRFKKVPTSYTELRSFFHLYYLLDWLPGCYNNWRGKPEDRQRVIRYFEELILETCAS